MALLGLSDHHARLRSFRWRPPRLSRSGAHLPRLGPHLPRTNLSGRSRDPVIRFQKSGSYEGDRSRVHSDKCRDGYRDWCGGEVLQSSGVAGKGKGPDGWMGGDWALGIAGVGGRGTVHSRAC